MSRAALAMAGPGPHPELPPLLASTPWEAGTALGRWLAPGALADEEGLARAAALDARARLGDFAPALGLLTGHERRRAELLLAWSGALAGTAAEEGEAAPRVARLHRAAFHLARALGGEPAESAFLRLLAAEAGRRAFGRPALDGLLAAARAEIETPRPATPEALAAHANDFARAFALGLAGGELPPAALDLAAGLLRLSRLLALPGELARGRCPLALSALPAPLQYRRVEEVGAAVLAEAEALRPLLLRGARAAAEVPLTFRRPLVFLVPAALELLGAVEERPQELARRAPRLSPWSRRRAYWRARWTSLA